MTKNHITDELLFAYADDELDESQILEVEQYLKSSKIARDKLAEIREVNSYLQDAVFSGSLLPPVREDIQSIIDGLPTEHELSEMRKQAPKKNDNRSSLVNVFKSWFEKKGGYGLPYVGIPQLGMAAVIMAIGIYIGGIMLPTSDVRLANNQLGEYSLDLSTQSEGMTLRSGVSADTDPSNPLDDPILLETLTDILDNRRVQSEIVVKAKDESSTSMRVHLINSFTSSQGLQCDNGEILDVQQRSYLFIGCQQTTGSWSIEFVNN